MSNSVPHNIPVTIAVCDHCAAKHGLTPITQLTTVRTKAGVGGMDCYFCGMADGGTIIQHPARMFLEILECRRLATLDATGILLHADEIESTYRFSRQTCERMAYDKAIAGFRSLSGSPVGSRADELAWVPSSQGGPLLQAIKRIFQYLNFCRNDAPKNLTDPYQFEGSCSFEDVRRMVDEIRALEREVGTHKQQLTAANTDADTMLHFAGHSRECALWTDKNGDTPGITKEQQFPPCTCGFTQHLASHRARTKNP